jgi:hypothetical protein
MKDMEKVLKRALDSLKEVFEYAIENRDSFLANLALSGGADANHKILRLGKPVLMVALENSMEQLAMILILRGGDIHVCNENGENPLSSAIRNRMSMVALELIERGSTLNLADIDFIKSDNVVRRALIEAGYGIPPTIKNTTIVLKILQRLEKNASIVCTCLKEYPEDVILTILEYTSRVEIVAKQKAILQAPKRERKIRDAFAKIDVSMFS